MKRILLLTLALLAGCTRTTEHPMPAPAPQADTITDWAKLQLAIAMTESEFKADAVSQEGDRGILQLRDIYIAEVNRLSGTDYTPTDAFDIAKSIEMFALMQDHKNPSHDTETAIYYHNKSNAYKRKVLENLAFVNRYENFRKILTE